MKEDSIVDLTDEVGVGQVVEADPRTGVRILGPKHPAPQFTKLRDGSDVDDDQFWNGFDKGHANGAREVQKQVARTSLFGLFRLRAEFRKRLK